MILPFSQKFPWGEPTNFAGKIIAPFLHKEDESNPEGELIKEHEDFFMGLSGEEMDILVEELHACVKQDKDEKFIFKAHTIRKDIFNRWKSGMKIHPVYFHRDKQGRQFQFCPTMICKSVQKIEIDYMGYVQNGSVRPVVKIDGNVLERYYQHELALNDGFTSVEQFFRWFDKDFSGKLIHWSDLKY